MASSGSITLRAWSVDKGSLASGTCYNEQNASTFGRGRIGADITLNYTVNDSGLFSVSYGGVSYIGSSCWCVCSVRGYNIDIDFSADGNNWTNIMHSWANNWQNCDTCYSGKANDVYRIAQDLSAGLTPVVLTQSGHVRARMWTPMACPTTAYPNAFPNDAASIATAVDVYIDVSWTARLQFNANGGSGAPGEQSHTQTGDSYTFTIPNTVPTWEWHRFEGWSTNSTATVPDYHPGDRITINKSNQTVILYAVWTEWYRVGDVRYNGTYRTTHRSGGKCHIRQNGQWVEMRSIDAGQTSPVDPPNRRKNGRWQNQYKIGQP